MKNCPHCNQPAEDNAAFCTQCGAPFTAAQPAPQQFVSAPDTAAAGSAGDSGASGQALTGLVHKPWFPVALMALALVIMWNWNIVVGVLAGVAAVILAVKSRTQLPKWALNTTYILGGIGVLMLLAWLFS